MATPLRPPYELRFGAFELDAANGELRKSGVALKSIRNPSESSYCSQNAPVKS